MKEQDTANKVINILSEKVALLIRENTIMSVMIEELNQEIKTLTEDDKEPESDE